MASNNTVNYINTNADLSVRIFDSFYAYEANVPAAEYDIVHSYFKSAMSDSKVAGNFAVSLFQVADQTKIPALELLDNIKGKTSLELSLNMAYYLNNIRSRATMLGVNAAPVPNYYAARAVMQ